jgi:hypothetical protein
MRNLKRLSLLLLVVILAACNFSPSPTPIQPTFPIPNQTMTALFSTPLPTIAVTKQPGLATATSPAPATATNPPPAPSATQPAVITATNQPPAPTQTTQPTQVPPTQAPPSKTPDLTHRTVTSASATYLSSKPVIDGDWNDLPDKEYPGEIVVFGGSAWTGRDDLAGSFRLGWDATNLYLGVKVRDDVYVQNSTGQNIFKGDSIEILLDTNVAADFYTTNVSADDYQLGITAGRPDVSGTKEAYLWLPANVAGSRSQVTIASQRSNAEGITRYEVAIPWSVFGITPKVGNHYGFVLSVSDNDNTSQNLQQTMVSNVKTRVLTNPTTWGDLTLK